ncbi:MAG: nitroreductase family protein [Syntrophobacterales bacterium]|nr:MAG: nitroreductase family protein [Syntrophobacterales bacterium]
MKNMAPFKTFVFRELSVEEMRRRAAEFADELHRRRSIRQFSPRHVPRVIIEEVVRAAGSAPSGANLQPWRFVVIGESEVKRRIREAAEGEERKFYGGRAPEKWLKALSPLGTNANKPFLEEAPWLIVVFAVMYGLNQRGDIEKHYYVKESVGIAVGILLTAIHQVGLCALPYTPHRMRFLNTILQRPNNEKPFVIIPVGYPATDAVVPNIYRKPLEEITQFL